MSEASDQRAYRPLDGVGTNVAHPQRGAAGSLLARGREGVAYADGMRRPIDRGNERTISRRFHALDDVLSPRPPSRLNMWAVLVGQFLNHDLEDNHFFGHWEDNNKSFATPDSPYQFVWVLDPEDPIATFRGHNRVANGEPCGIPFKPSVGGFVDGVFAPANRSTSYLDLAHVYGAEYATSRALRAFIGGRLKTEDYAGTSTYRTELGPVKVDYDVDNLLPSRETTGLHVDTSFTRLMPNEVCTGGDARTSENMGLLQVQVLFLREHNWRADRLVAAHPDWDDERTYQEARRWTIAVWQHVLVDEWMPAVCGAEASDRLGTYGGYDEAVDVTTALVFATNALRAGHSMLHPYVPRNPDGSPSTRRVSEALPPDGSLPNVGQVNNGISPMAHYAIAGGSPEHIVRGMLATAAQQVGLVYNSAIHDIAFVSGGTDLMTLDLVRGRDNGVPPYHVLRTIHGGFVNDGDWAAEADVISETEKRAMIDRGERLERRTALTNFLRFAARDPEDPTHDEVAIATRIQDVYRRADSIDPMVGLLAEPHVEDSCVGRTFQNILIDQIQRCRTGDRFWYENAQFDADELREIRGTSMRDLLVRHFDLAEVPDKAFLTVDAQAKGAARVITYATDVHGDEADVYAPDSGTHPLVLLLHGSHVHRRHYSRFAPALAAYGFVVLVPSHTRELFGEAAYYPEQAQAGWAVEWARAESARADSPLSARIDNDSFFVVGHSFGGAVALGIATKDVVAYLNEEPVDFPDELKAVAAIGTHNVPPRGTEPMPVDNQVPLAMVQGTIDGTVRYEQAAATFDVVQQAPKLFVTLEGANHYPVTDDDDPIDANTDHATAHADLDQAVAIATIAEWLATWFAAHDGDDHALDRLRAATKDPLLTPAHVTVALVE